MSYSVRDLRANLAMLLRGAERRDHGRLRVDEVIAIDDAFIMGVRAALTAFDAGQEAEALGAAARAEAAPRLALELAPPEAGALHRLLTQFDMVAVRVIGDAAAQGVPAAQQQRVLGNLCADKEALSAVRSRLVDWFCERMATAPLRPDDRRPPAAEAAGATE